MLSTVKQYYKSNTSLVHWGVFLILTVPWFAKRVYYLILNKNRRARFKYLIRKRKEQCEKSFEADFDINALIPEEIQAEILKTDLNGLKKLLIAKELTSENLLKFYYMRAKTRGRELRATVESLLDSALPLAKKADAILAEQGEAAFEEFPLLGLPITIKESVELEGYDCTQGYPTRCGRPAKATAPVVTELIRRGGIPFARTNIPQGIMTAVESVNPVYGRTLNAHNPGRTSGGSSGGEGVAVGACCSPIGLASDLGGSIRLPSLLNGAFAFLPTPGRISFKGHPIQNPAPRLEVRAQTLIDATYGPIAKSVSDLNIFMNVIGQRALGNGVEAQIPPMDWDNATATAKPKSLNSNTGKVKIGYYTKLEGLLGSTKYTQKAVLRVVEALKQAGYEVEEIEVPNIMELFTTFIQIIMSDGNIQYMMTTDLHGVELEKVYHTMWMVYNMWPTAKKFIGSALKNLVSKRMGTAILNMKPVDSKKLFALANKHVELKKKFYEYLQKRGISFTLGPGCATSAFINELAADASNATFYSGLYNTLGMPNGVLPILKIPDEDDEYLDPVNDPLTQNLNQHVKGTKGLPIGVIVGGFPYQDESVIAMMREIEQLMDLKALVKA